MADVPVDQRASARHVRGLQHACQPWTGCVVKVVNGDIHVEMRQPEYTSPGDADSCLFPDVSPLMTSSASWPPL